MKINNTTFRLNLIKTALIFAFFLLFQLINYHEVFAGCRTKYDDYGEFMGCAGDGSCGTSGCHSSGCSANYVTGDCTADCNYSCGSNDCGTYTCSACGNHFYCNDGCSTPPPSPSPSATPCNYTSTSGTAGCGAGSCSSLEKLTYTTYTSSVPGCPPYSDESCDYDAGCDNNTPCNYSTTQRVSACGGNGCLATQKQEYERHTSSVAGCPPYSDNGVCVDYAVCTSCTATCGGTDCGDLGATPNAPSNILVNSISSGNVSLTNSDLQIEWTDNGISDSTASTDSFVVYIWDRNAYAQPTPPSPCNDANNCVSIPTASAAITSINTNASYIYDNNIYITVEAINSDPCATAAKAMSNAIPFNLIADISGTFYNDPSAEITPPNSCSGNDTSTQATFSPSSWTLQNGDTVLSDGLASTYTINDLPYAPNNNWDNFLNTLDLYITNPNPDSAWTCMCPGSITSANCSLSDIAVPSNSNNFFVSDIDLSHSAWWQASAGNVYSANSLTSIIPDTCESSSDCNANLVTKNTSDDTNSAGIPLTGATSMSVEGYYTDRTTQTKALNTNHNNMIKENYAFFTKEVDFSSAYMISGYINSLPTGATPDSSDNVTELYYRNSNLIVDFTGSPQNITAGTKKIIFVDGNITFNADTNENMLTVEEGGFVAFIASGNITFNSDIGNEVEYGIVDPTDNSPNIAGVFIADGTINLNGYSDAALKDNKFVGEGTFVGWSGINLTRDYDNTTNSLDKAINNTNPTEVFSFRPDFNVNIPAIMKRPNLIWQEVN